MVTRVVNRSVSTPGLKRVKRSPASSSHEKEASDYFRRIRARLYKNPTYRGKYVVIRDRKIVDVDADKFVLFERIVKNFPDQRFLVMPVWSEFPAVSVGS